MGSCDQDRHDWSVLVQPHHAKVVKTLVESHQWRDPVRKITRIASCGPLSSTKSTWVAIPLNTDFILQGEQGLFTRLRKLPDGCYPGFTNAYHMTKPVTSDTINSLPESWHSYLDDIMFCHQPSGPLPTDKHQVSPSLVTTPGQRIAQLAQALITTLKLTPMVSVPSQQYDWNTLTETLPRKWEKYGTFVLFPETTFQSDIWNQLLPTFALPTPTLCQSENHILGTPVEAFLQGLAQCLQATHLARKFTICQGDVLRRPVIIPLFGAWGEWRRYPRYQPLFSNVQHPIPDPPQSLCYSSDIRPPDEPLTGSYDETYWATARQNGLTYHWAPIHTMFCSGNISEKVRVATSSHYRAAGATVVDLYAGVGYFTFPYLIHAGATVVHACELNPWSVEGLCRGAVTNSIPYRIRRVSHKTGGEVIPGQHPENDTSRLYIYQGDNQDAVPFFEHQADHVNLGLLPSSEAGWPLAVRALRPEGGYLHVHTNQPVGELTAWLEHLRTSLTVLLQKYHPRVGSKWQVEVVHVENVKSYAPKINHYVADVLCLPKVDITFTKA
ncbi:S-adenosylmethionine-dependent methyltransferase [Dispira parvispora]|uniref:tRNA(Phe) (4-demethylwyosine(37)-C(7)) aminocarboxypropyltransferase n=1 Tax=Dispira parvispora TaxID=1520584 RepID=A0A9W8ASI2_9FUNG|nr:S-adenosylmethionine-dependent methyltransferase [Dispira parvispora]